MIDSSRWPLIACVLSVAAFGMGAASLLTARKAAPQAGGQGGAVAPTCDDAAALKRDLADIRAQLAAIRGQSHPAPDQQLAGMSQRLAQVEAALAQQETDAGAAKPRAPAQQQNPLDQFRPAYAEIRSPSPSVTIRQGPDRMFVVSNSDPALAGTPISVEAVRADGSVDGYAVMLPAPSDSPAMR